MTINNIYTSPSMELATVISTISPLSETSVSKITDLTELVKFPKGHLLFKSGRVEKYLFFIKKGIARAYILQDDIQVTFWFGTEGSIVFPIKSYVENKPSYEDIDLLEDCELYRISIADLQKLYFEDIEIANWGRKLAEQELIKAETKIVNRQFRTASERYQELIETYPMLLKRVSLGIIATYLGITQVTLSRIRAEK